MDMNVDRPYVCVIGGANLDICGHCFEEPVPRDSNLGRVSSSVGGVGRNIAEMLSGEVKHVFFLGAVGRDAAGERILKSAEKVDFRFVKRSDRYPSSTYLYLEGPDGDMVLAVNDMDILKEVDEEYLQANRALLKNASAVVVDANLEPDMIRLVAELTEAPLFADCVSAAKCRRLLPVLSCLTALKPNRLEAETLTGISITDEESLRAAAEKLLGEGVHSVYITLGADGVYAAERGKELRLPAQDFKRNGSTGAGDAFTAGIVSAYIKGMDLGEAAAYAQLLAAGKTEE